MRRACQTQAVGTLFDGVARHTEEGHGFVRRSAESGFKDAVRERDNPSAITPGGLPVSSSRK